MIANLRKNFLVVGVVVGMLWRALIGDTLPWFLDSFTSTAGQAFTPLVLYLAGCASVGTVPAYGGELNQDTWVSCGVMRPPRRASRRCSSERHRSRRHPHGSEEGGCLV